MKKRKLRKPRKCGAIAECVAVSCGLSFIRILGSPYPFHISNQHNADALAKWFTAAAEWLKQEGE